MIRSWILLRSLKLWVGIAWLLMGWLGICSTAAAADPSFVGVLALAVDKDVADRLGLSEEVRGRLRQLVNEREDAALEIVLSIKDLPPLEQTARLTPFVADSERLGFALLTVSQREKLQQLRLAREGMSGLAEPGLAEALSLSSEQRTTVEQLLTQRAADMTKGGERERRITRAVYERKLAAILSESQRAAWEKMAGLVDAPVSQVASPAKTASPPSEAPATAPAAAPSAEAATKPEPEAAAPKNEASVAAPAVDSSTNAEPAPAEAPSTEATAKSEMKATPENAAAAPSAATADDSAAKAEPAPAAGPATEAVAKPEMEAAPQSEAAAPPAAPADQSAAQAEPASAAAPATDAGAKPEMEAAPQDATVAPPAAQAGESAIKTEPAPDTAPPPESTANPKTESAPESLMPAASTAPDAGSTVKIESSPSPAAPAEATAQPEMGAAPATANPFVDPARPVQMPPEDVAPEQAAPPPEPPAAGAAEAAKPESPAPAAGPGLMHFQFDAAPWKDVLEWLAQQSGLSLAIETLPVGTFTYRDDRMYTVDEALDLLNSYLLTKGYTLVRRERILLVLDVENPIPEELVTLVTTDELDKRGRFELVKCLFPLARMKAEDAAAMIKDFVGPQGKVIPFPKARQILVTETAGKLRTIRDMIARYEDPMSGGAETVYEINLQHASSEEVLSIARPLLGIPEGQNSGSDINLSVDLLGTRIFASGSADKLQLLRELIPKIDKAPPQTGEAAKEPEKLSLKTYFIKAADVQLVLRVAQTLLADLPGVRLEVDATSGKLVAWARPTEHRIIEETLKQLEGQDLQFEVIQLKKTDPQLAVAAINKFFNLGSTTSTSKDAAKTSPQGPIVDGDPVTMQLWVRGTVLQIEQVKDLIEKLDGAETEQVSGEKIRTIPLSGAAAKSALETIEQFWTRKNKIRFVTPSALTPSADIKLRVITPLQQEPEDAEPADAQPEAPFDGWPQMPAPSVEPPAGPAAGKPSEDASSAGKSARRRHSDSPTSAAAAGQPRFFFVSQPKPIDEPAAAAAVGPEGSEPADDAPAGEAPEIRIAVTPSGIVIASEDTKALDELEKLLRTVSGPTALQGQREISVFYLKYARADVAYQLLQEVLGGHASETGGSLLGDMASNLLGGGLIGGLVGGLAGGTSSGSSNAAATLQASGPVTMVPDPRLNALIVEANPVDLAFIEQMLRVIDKEGSETDIETTGATHLIPVIHSTADEVATVVRQVFADRIATTQGGGGGQQPSPEDFLRALRGQRSRREDAQTRGEQQKMTVGVDSRSNSVIVTGPESLYRQVEDLVRKIDQPGGTDTDVVSVVPIRVSDPELVQKTLNSILGTNSRSGSRSSSGSSFSGGSSGGPSSDDIRRRIEFFQQLRGSGGPPGGFGGPPGGFGGFSGRGGSGPSGADSGGRSFGGRSRGR